MAPLLLFGTAQVHAEATGAERLAEMSLEDLAEIRVTVASRRAEPLAEVPASVFVITANDIRRSGARSLPEALRLAPNLNVARVSASEYAISARGNTSTAGNKLQVLIDGRIAYTPLFSGVFWDVQEVLLEDIDRIEVISGPNSTLWGSNAVNGVINVVTRKATDTLDGFAAAGASHREARGALRYGGELADWGHYRVYASAFDEDDSLRESGGSASDAWRKTQVGFRADRTAGSDSLRVQGDAYTGRIEQPTADDREVSGLNLLTRWTRAFTEGGDLRVQAYYDRTEREYPGRFAETLDIFDVDIQHQAAARGRHRIVWGGNVRHARDRVDNSVALAFLPARKDLSWYGLFAQDDIGLSPAVRLILGGRVEWNEYTDVEFMPSVRLAWQATEQQFVWLSAARAVRTPSRVDRELFSPGTPPFVFAGGPDFRSEIADVVEAGYRAQPTRNLNFSVTLFHADYDRIRSIEPTPEGAVQIGNGFQGTTKGVEFWGAWQVHPGWRLSGGGVYLDQELHRDPSSQAIRSPASEGDDPEWRWMLRSSHDLWERGQFDVVVRRVGSLPFSQVPAYTAVDARFGWHLRGGVELFVSGQNLLDRRHAEFGAASTRGEFPRSVFLGASWHF